MRLDKFINYREFGVVLFSTIAYGATSMRTFGQNKELQEKQKIQFGFTILMQIILIISCIVLAVDIRRPYTRKIIDSESIIIPLFFVFFALIHAGLNLTMYGLNKNLRENYKGDFAGTVMMQILLVVLAVIYCLGYKYDAISNINELNFLKVVLKEIFKNSKKSYKPLHLNDEANRRLGQRQQVIEGLLGENIRRANNNWQPTA
jgi:small-conductance mechanosensitive channel